LCDRLITAITAQVFTYESDQPPHSTDEPRSEG
jgi:hypothetical protein